MFMKGIKNMTTSTVTTLYVAVSGDNWQAGVDRCFASYNEAIAYMNTIAFLSQYSRFLYKVSSDGTHEAVPVPERPIF